MDILLSFITLVVGAIIGWVIKLYLQGYSQQKGQNLATKEDIEEITRKVEGVKSEISVSLEVIKWELGKKATLHRLAAEKQFEALAEIGKTLYELQSATVGLRPAFDRYDKSESPMDRHNRRYKQWTDAIREFMEIIEKYKLFLPTDLYKQLVAIQNICHKEGVGFELAIRYAEEPGKLSFNDFTDAQKNMEQMYSRIDNALVLVRQRYDLDS